MFTSLASSLRVVLISSPLNFNARMSLLTKRCVKRAWVAGAVGVGGILRYVLEVAAPIYSLV